MDSARAIEHLVYAYAERIDAGDLAAVAELFTCGRIQAAPGAWSTRAPNRCQSMYDNGPPPVPTARRPARHHERVDHRGRRQRHRIRPLVLHTVFQATEDLPLQAIIAGHYHDTFHRVDDAASLRHRENFVDLTGDLSRHLKFDL
ncbi:MAG: nuclear transport factor 2 family protein [Ilumatobacteraceae bacterium]